MEFQDQSVLVTGGASGLGLASARAALELGAHVTIGDLPSSPGAKVAADLGERGTVKSDPLPDRCEFKRRLSRMLAAAAADMDAEFARQWLKAAL